MENTTENKFYCHDCGSETGADADFCSFCGIRLDKSRENLGSDGSPGNESVAPTPLLAKEGWPKAGVEGVAGASESESENPENVESPESVERPESLEGDDDDQPTMLYTSAEFEKLVTGDISENSADSTDTENSTDFTDTENSMNSDSIDSKNSTDPLDPLDSIDSIDSPDDLPPAPEFLSAGAPAEISAEIAAEPSAQTAAEAPADAKAENEAENEAEVEKSDTGEEAPYTSQIESPENTGGRKVGKQSQILTEGTLLNNRYEIVRKIGGGGMGAVYLASDRNLGGVLRAVKEMVQSHIEPEQQEKALADFKRESMLLTSLEHPCIPTIYDYFYEEPSGRFYLVMKYISGGDLAARLRSAPEGRVDEKSVTEWAAQTADVLDYLHSRRPPIVYRDLKPSNLMIDGNTGRIMLIDFGIARWVTKNEKDVTAVGTMGYAPPELFSGNVEPRSDIYSLGATMFHLLTGADPQSNPLLIFDFSKNPRPRQVNPAVSNEMEHILMRTVEYNVELRYNSAEELREALIGHLERVRYGQLTYGQPQAGPPVSALQTGAVSGQNLVFCGFCGEKIIENDVFCPFCGAKQAVADQVRKTPFGQIVQPKRVLARVTVLGTGELNPPTYDLEKESNVVGRRDPQTNIFPEVDLSKFDPQTKISRRHARIWKEGETFMIEDLGSSNGTVVVSSMNEANKLSPHQPQILIHGSKLVLGDTTLHFVVG